jgi:DNA repair protein RecO (recombination protein O)
MDSKVMLQPGFILHQRSYRETSALVDIFSHEFGIVRLVARGAKRKARGKLPLRAFKPLLFSWYGTSSLKTLTGLDTPADFYMPYLQGKQLLVGMYINEIVYKLLGFGVAYTALYTQYQYMLDVLAVTSDDALAAVSLRFERALIDALGYGINFEQDSQRKPISKHASYTFVPNKGFMPATHGAGAGVDILLSSTLESTFSGGDLIAIGQDKYITNQAIASAQRLFALVINSLLKRGSLHSQMLLQSVYTHQLSEVRQ